MAGLKKKQRTKLIMLGMLFLFAASGLVLYAFRDGINLYRDPSTVLADKPAPSEVFKLGGMVKDGSLEQLDEGGIRFVVSDGAEEIAVSYSGILPDLFREGQGVVATGSMTGIEFSATEILAKHDENYMPREVVDSLKKQGVYQGND